VTIVDDAKLTPPLFGFEIASSPAAIHPPAACCGVADDGWVAGRSSGGVSTMSDFGDSTRVRVLVYAAAPSGEPAAVEAAYHQISRDLAGTPGMLRNELLRAADDPGAFVVMSEWESLAAFRSWEEGAAHREATAPLRRYQQAPGPRPFRIYEVAATY